MNNDPFRLTRGLTDLVDQMRRALTPFGDLADSMRFARFGLGMNSALHDLMRTPGGVLGKHAGMFSALGAHRALAELSRAIEGSGGAKSIREFARITEGLAGRGVFTSVIAQAETIAASMKGQSLGTTHRAWFEDMKKLTPAVGASSPLLSATKDLSDLSRAFISPLTPVDLWGGLAREHDALGALRGHVRALDLLQRGGRKQKRDIDGYEEHGVIHDPSARELSHPDAIDRLHLPADSRSAIERAEFFPLHLVADFLREPRLMQSMHWRRFEELVAEIFFRNGAREVVLMPGTKDGGKDIVARVVRNGVPVVCYIQCKRYRASARIEVDTVRALLGVVRADGSDAQHGALVTTAHFTRDCKKFIASQSALEGHDFDDLKTLLHTAYPQLPRG